MDYYYSMVTRVEPRILVTHHCGLLLEFVGVSWVIPNAFTPGDNDDINDYFGLSSVGCSFTEYDLRIFSRVGTFGFSDYRS